MSDRASNEIAHYAGWANRYGREALARVRTRFLGSTAPENRWILEKLGDLKGKKLLDIGCGSGESTVFLSSLGAEATGLDLSPDMIRVAETLAGESGSTARFRTGDAQSLPFPDKSFDVVYAANVMHHCDPDRCIAEWRRVLKDGGVLAFWDPLAHNPVINVYRRMATKMRTPDETPLSWDRLPKRLAAFRSFERQSFWLATLAVFLKFFLWDRIHPNTLPYWEAILDREPELRPLYSRLERFDRWLFRLPFLRRYAWNVAVIARR